ncbi:alcohol dehydrogenase [Jiangella alba]|uniref:Alcohol dehydrogenase n=2 Tax=Jiangella alba TaxID=561176 RepID=A0A1H5PPD9_9ACTN|nr:zinc-dependent alcohol dehydrogenase family protein [Jiangella alba]SEF15625.1 alcohol dehydrogenase [Jiangella alba]
MRYERFRERPVVLDVAEPACPPGGAVIRVEATGLCRSDWHGWMGHDDDIALPHVPGHELAGVLAEVGPDVAAQGWRPGERVTVPFVCACGSCEQCRAGDHQVCERQTQPGFTHWGSFAEFVAIEHAAVNLVRLPDAVGFATAAGLGCRFATAYRAVVQQGRVAPGEWVAVHGCGGLGLSAVMIAAAHGARVVAVDVAAPALELARSVGAAVAVDASDGTDVVAAVREATGGGAHLSLDALGSTATFQNSVRGLRRRGRHVQAGLLVAEHASQSVTMGPVVGTELELLGSHGMAAHHYPAMLAEIAAGTLRPDLLLGRELSLEDGVDALLAMSDGSPTGVTVLRPNGPFAGT